MNDRRDATLSAVAELASKRCTAPADLLDGYLELLSAASLRGRQVAEETAALCRERGADAAQRGVPLGRLTALFVVAAELSWETMAARRSASNLYASGKAVLAVTAQAVSALAEGFDAAQRAAVNPETAARTDFVDELLVGAPDLDRLAERAQHFGIPLVGSQVVAVARSPQGFSKNDRVVRVVEAAMVARFGSGNVLVTVRDSLVACILAASLRGAAGEFAHQLLLALGPEAGWQVGVSRPHSGPSGVSQSYSEARETLALADSLGFDVPVLHAADFLVFPVLLRDRDAMVDLVETVLSPLALARTGAKPLLETLAAVFSCQGNSAAAARTLGVSVRTVTYRLDRVFRLTGYSATEPTQRFTLEAAVLGARILGWPERPLTATAPEASRGD